MPSKLNQFIIGIGAIIGWGALALWAAPTAYSMMVSSAVLLLVPGHLLYRIIVRDNQSDSFWSTLSYSTVLSCLWLMIVGLLLSAFTPLVGNWKPLEPATLVPTLALSTGALLGIALHRTRQLWPGGYQTPQGAKAWTIVMAGALLPLLAVAGAFILNNGGSSVMAMTALAGGIVYALWQIWSKRDKLQFLYPFALYVISLALLFANSMRGWYITGHDIQQEYQVFQLTATHGIWSMSLLQNAYTACLSITILPTILAKLTGVPDAYVYKLMFQMLFALVPVMIYQAGARFLPKRGAFLAAFIFISFPTFFTDMSFLNRQEIAFAFFAMIMLAAFDEKLSKRTTSVMVLLLALGMVFSHYSTSYVAGAVLLCAKLIETAMWGWNRWRHKHPGVAVVMPISWPITLALLLGIYLWDNQITSTSQSIATTIGGIATSLPAVFDSSQETGQGTLAIGGHELTNQQLFAQFVQTAPSTRTLPQIDYYPSSVTNKYPLSEENGAVAPLTAIGKVLASVKIPLFSLYSLTRSGYAALIEGLILVGLGVLSWRPRVARVPLQYLLLGIASLAMIVLEALLPDVIDYGLLRLIQQSLIVMAPVIVIAGYYLLGLVKTPITWRFRIMGLVLVGFFMVNVGFLPELTGGFSPVLPLSNSGLYYEAYYTHATELAGGQWLVDNAPVGATINSDQFAQRKLIAYFNLYSQPTLEPAAISKQAYVYVSYADTVFGRAPFYYNGNLLYQQTPTAFLSAQKNLLYSNGDVEIYQ